MKLTLVLIFCLSFSVFGAAAFLTALFNYVKARAIPTWPTVAAKLTECTLDRHGSNHDSVTVRVAYEYEVSGKQYIGTDIHPMYTGSNSPEHKRFFAHLKEVESFKARYNPDDHSEAYMSTQTTRPDLFGFAFGSLMFAAGLGFAACFWTLASSKQDYIDGVEVLLRRDNNAVHAEHGLRGFTNGESSLRAR